MINQHNLRKPYHKLVTLFRILTIIALALPMMSPATNYGTTPAKAAPTNVVNLNVISARTEPAAFNGAGVTKGDAITKYKYIINIDNTGTTTQRPDPTTGALPTACTPADPGYPDSCQWVSIAGSASSSPIYTQGDQNDFTNGLTLPDGRYLISVLADGYKLDGTHFTVPLSNPVTVELQPWPLPDATIQAEIFEDVSPTNSAPDVPAERGLAGFVGHIADYIGEVTTNVYGDPLCGPGGCVSQCYVVNNSVDVGTVAPIDADGRCPIGFSALTDPLLNHTITQTLEGSPIPAGATIQGKLIIPNIGTNRYALSAVAPNGSHWIQTTTLEGNHDWDAWVMEGATGLDTEFVAAGEPFPAIFFGFVQPKNELTTPAAGMIKGSIAANLIYVPAKGGLSLGGTNYGGLAGGKIDHMIENPWVSLSDLTQGDTSVYVAQGDANGNFTIPNVPDGDYTLAYWDEPQDYILDILNVSVRNGETVDLGVIPLNGWWTNYYGHIFNDLNGNGKMDPGEPGLAGFPVAMKKRENSMMDRGAVLVSTDAEGYYFMENAYPMTQWLVMEVYSDLYYTTGVTYQADNQSTETTVLGQGVDVNVLPIIGLGGRLDWGVRAYDKGTNGGIVGTVSYDTTRNELDPRFAAVEDWQPGVSNIPVELFQPVPCPRDSNTGDIAVGAVCDNAGRYQLDTDGSFKKGKLLNTYVTETWQNPTGCVARDVDGKPMVHGVDENVLPLSSTARCLEGPLMSIQFGPMDEGQGTPAANFGAAVDGNYGFGDGCFNGTLDASDPANPICVGGDFTALTPADYLVHIVIPNDAQGRPQYKVTKEEDINIFNGDEFVTQAPPPACVGALHTVDLKNSGAQDAYSSQNVAFPGGSITVPASTPVDNQAYADAGGSYYEGQARPLCDTKLVPLSDRRSIAPTFNVFTDVPLPGRFWGLLVDDLNFSSDPRSLLFGEKAGIAFAPVGIYDYTNRLVATTESDFNGLFDVLLPSTNRISCPTPSGVCANLYRFVGNDPGTPGHLNLNYNPQFRTIAAEFEAFPGLLVPADLAPTQVGVNVQLPGGQTGQPVNCSVNDPAAAIKIPEFYAISKPFMRSGATGADREFTIYGKYFGNVQGTGQVLFKTYSVPVVSWSDTQIKIAFPDPLTAKGFGDLKVVASNGKSSVNGITFHIVKPNGTGGYDPVVYEVGPGLTGANQFNATDNLHAIQQAIDAATANTTALVVVYPNNPDLVNPRANPRGAYFENLILSTPVKLQGVGPGSPDGSIRGSIIDGSAIGGDTTLADDWRAKIASLTWAGNQTVYEGADVTWLARTTTLFTPNFRASLDGFDLRGGDQMGFPANINAIGGGATGLPANVTTQGGAIFVNAYVRYLEIKNNIVQNNGGAYGAIRIGTPNLPAPETSQHNDNVVIARNRIINNAGTNLAGAIGIFAGSKKYAIAYNDICGNFSAEYGGAISQYGFSPSGLIHDNRIYYNSSYDEGGGIMLAGQLTANPDAASPGTGKVTVWNNLIQGNLSNDDGGGLRILMAGDHGINLFNNMIVNNISTHEGGGIALNDSTNVRIYNNTIMRNITTATAVTSTGNPAPAGLSSSENSAALQALLPITATVYSDPLLFNNIFWDNRAGLRGVGTVYGIGLPDDPGPVNNWDMGVANSAFTLSPTYSILQTTLGTVSDPSNLVGVDPLVISQTNISVTFQPWRTNPLFTGAMMVTENVPPSLLGNYHLSGTGSPAFNAGVPFKAFPIYRPLAPWRAPSFDYDNEGRPAFGAYDAGADEIPQFADLSITKTDGVTTANRGDVLHYTIVVGNAGPDPVTAANVVDTLPTGLTGATWTCSASTGSSCPASGSGSINAQVNLLTGGSATFTLNATVSSSTPGALTNTATISGPGIDTNPANNSAADTDQITIPLPVLGLLDNFNRADANTLNNGTNWSQPVLAGSAAVRVNSNQAFAILPGQALWNNPPAGFGSNQGASFVFSSAPANNTVIFLKGTAGTATAPQNYIRILLTSTSVAVGTNAGATFTTRATYSGVTFAVGDTITAVAYGDGKVEVFKTSGGVTSLVGSVAIPTSGAGAWTQGTGGGRIGVILPLNARIDDFKGGNLP